MREIGAAAMPIIPSFDGIKGQLEQGLNRPLREGGTEGGRQYGENAGRSLTASLGKHAKKAALLATGAFAGIGVGAFKFSSDAVALAADLEQSIGAVDTVFGGSAERIHKWAKSAANDVGLTRNEFNELGSLIGTQLKNGGTAMDRLAPKTNKLITLGADLSSMFGGSTAEAVEALSSALKGERDPIERYGVTLNDAAIKAEALQTGLVKTTKDASAVRQASIKLTVAQAKYNEEIRKHGKDSLEAVKAEGQLLAATDRFNKASAGKVEELTDQQKQTATLSLIYKQTADAQGNFAKESDTLSGKQQRLKASLEDTKTEIGTALLPIVADAADFLLKKGVPAFQKFADWFGDKGAPAIQTFVEDMKPVADEVIPAIGKGVEAIGGFLKDAAPLAKDLVGAFNNMPDWITDTAVLGALGLGVAAKVKGGKGGGAAGLLGKSKGATAANPMYVWVVNGAAGPLGAGGGGKGGKPGVVPLSGASPLLAIAGGVIVADNGQKILNGLQTSSGPSTASVEAIKSALEQSDVAAVLSDDELSALSQGLASQGKNSQEFKDAVEKLKKTNDGAWEDINELIPVVGSWITTSGDQAAWALKDLKKIADDTAEAARLDRLQRAQLADLLSAGGPSGAGASTTTRADTFYKIPDAKLKLLQDPETVKTREDVRKLLGDVDGLTRKDYKVIFNALGLKRAKDDAEDLLGYLRQLSGINVDSLSYPKGFIGPVPSGTSPSRRTDRRSATGLRVDNVTINSLNANRLIADLQDIQRRTAIGGY